MNLSLPVEFEHGIIRLLQAKDIESVYKIYTPYIPVSAITFETEIPSPDDFKTRIEKIKNEFPFLVFEDKAGEVHGYAYVTKYRERAAYQWCVESSIYVSEKYFGKGVADKLYASLISICKTSGFRRIYGAIALPNERSEAFHRKFGFEQFAVFEKTGFKLGQWWDVAWYELVLDGSSEPPEGMAS